MVESLCSQIIWGCDPQRQLEAAWLRSLLSNPVEEELLALTDVALDRVLISGGRVLVESGLLRLEREKNEAHLALQRRQRESRLAALEKMGSFILLHLSDEEGFDGDELYPMLPSGTVVWRNFPYPRFSQAPWAETIHTFPIGPRGEFLSPGFLLPIDQRPYPWSFMGTLWSSGSRVLATSLFLKDLPQGFFHGGKCFARGIPLQQYKAVLGQSVFALCPEGDRHLDTFRLYESLQMGCIPLLVDFQDQAVALLGPNCPIPCFPTWQHALDSARKWLAAPDQLSLLHDCVWDWWVDKRFSLTRSLAFSLGIQDVVEVSPEVLSSS